MKPPPWNTQKCFKYSHMSKKKKKIYKIWLTGVFRTFVDESIYEKKNLKNCQKKSTVFFPFLIDLFQKL